MDHDQVEARAMQFAVEQVEQTTDESKLAALLFNNAEQYAAIIGHDGYSPEAADRVKNVVLRAKASPGSWEATVSGDQVAEIVKSLEV